MKIFNTTFYKLVYDLAIMSNNVYRVINQSSWIDLPNYSVKDITLDNNTVKSFYFYNKDTNIISFKGTTTVIGLQEDGEFVPLHSSKSHILSSSYNDKFNDNLYFSCCFYKQSNLFNSSSCSCEIDKDKNICCKSCYKDSIDYILNYINLAKEIVEKIKDNIDFDNVIFTGHSLGGTLATLMGILYNKTSVSFQSPGDKHYLDLIGLRSHQNTFHFGHNADPIFLGTCGNTCWTFGYNLYTKCHSGFSCVYDAKEKLGYTESILNHRIDTIIKNIIPHWENDFPECVQNKDCSDCENWIYN